MTKKQSAPSSISDRTPEEEPAGAISDAEAAVEEELGIEDATGMPDGEDYDFGELAAGVQPTKRSVMIYQKNDIRALLDDVEEMIRIRGARGDDTSENEAAREALAEELLESGRKVTIQAWTSDRIKKFAEEMTENGIDPWGIQRDLEKLRARHSVELRNAQSRNFRGTTEEKMLARHEAAEGALVEELQAQYVAALYEQVAQQIVFPKTGVTAAAVRQIAEANEVEGNKLYAALKAANGSPAVGPDFSRKRSGLTGTRVG